MHVFSMLLLLFPLSAFCQTVRISGKLTSSEGDPLMFASVSLKGSMDGTTTDEEGVYSFHTAQKGQHTLVGS